MADLSNIPVFICQSAAMDSPVSPYKPGREEVNDDMYRKEAQKALKPGVGTSGVSAPLWRSSPVTRQHDDKEGADSNESKRKR
jgi:hypothetical protein